VPTQPVTTQYVINSGPLVINIAPNFTQYPPCAYAVTEHFTWETDPYGALHVGSDYTLTLDDSDLFHAKTYTFKLINSVAWQLVGFTPFIEFDIEYLHPCRRATFSSPTITDMTYTLRNSHDVDQTVVEPTDSVSLLYDTLDGYTTCGDRVFHVQDMTTGATATWVSVLTDADLTPAEVISIGPLGHTFLLRVSNDDEATIGTTTFTVSMSFADYPLSGDASNTVFSDTFDVVVSGATCECGLITWHTSTITTLSTSIAVATVTDGLVEVGPDLGTQVLTAGARACGSGAASCDYTYTIEAFYGTEATTLTALPVWMTYVRPNLSVTPPTTAEMGVHSVSLK